MKEQAGQKGKNKKVETTGAKSLAGTEGKTPEVKAAPLTAKEKIAANQRSKKRR